MAPTCSHVTWWQGLRMRLWARMLSNLGVRSVLFMQALRGLRPIELGQPTRSSELTCRAITWEKEAGAARDVVMPIRRWWGGGGKRGHHDRFIRPNGTGVKEPGPLTNSEGSWCFMSPGRHRIINVSDDPAMHTYTHTHIHTRAQAYTSTHKHIKHTPKHA